MLRRSAPLALTLLQQKSGKGYMVMIVKFRTELLPWSTFTPPHPDLHPNHAHNPLNINSYLFVSSHPHANLDANTLWYLGVLFPEQGVTYGTGGMDDGGMGWICVGDWRYESAGIELPKLQGRLLFSYRMPVWWNLTKKIPARVMPADVWSRPCGRFLGPNLKQSSFSALLLAPAWWGRLWGVTWGSYRRRGSSLWVRLGIKTLYLLLPGATASHQAKLLRTDPITTDQNVICSMKRIAFYYCRGTQSAQGTWLWRGLAVASQSQSVFIDPSQFWNWKITEMRS